MRGKITDGRRLQRKKGMRNDRRTEGKGRKKVQS